MRSPILKAGDRQDAMKRVPTTLRYRSTVAFICQQTSVKRVGKE
jgi:hypothetical protein